VVFLEKKLSQEETFSKRKLRFVIKTSTKAHLRSFFARKKIFFRKKKLIFFQKNIDSLRCKEKSCFTS